MNVVTSTDLPNTNAAATGRAPALVITRRTIDGLLIAAGALATIVLLISAGLLTWGNSFAGDYVGKELSSQHISFPDAAALTAEGRTDLVGFAGQNLNTGREAQGYASYINGHLAKIGSGMTYAEMGKPETAAKADVTAATAAGKTPAEVATLQTKADALTNSRNSLFKGETLRGLLLTAYAWSTMGKIAGIAAIVAFIAAAMMATLVGLGLLHHRKAKR